VTFGRARERRDSRARRYIGLVTPREKLHRLVDELSETEVEAALTGLFPEREAVEQRFALAV
jgi:hypothetical protein